MTLRHFRVRMFILSSRTICSTPFLEYLTTHLHFNVLTYISLLDHIQLCNETANGLLVHFKMYFLPTRMIRIREALLKNGKNAVQYVSVLKKLEKVASFQHITTMQHTTYSTYFKNPCQDIFKSDRYLLSPTTKNCIIFHMPLPLPNP